MCFKSKFARMTTMTINPRIQWFPETEQSVLRFAVESVYFGFRTARNRHNERPVDKFNELKLVHAGRSAFGPVLERFQNS